MKMQYGFDDKVPAGKAVPWALQYVFTIFTGSMTGSIMLASGAGMNSADTAFLIQCGLFACCITTLIQSLGIRIGKFQIGARLPLVSAGSWTLITPMVLFANDPNIGIPGAFGAACLGTLLLFLLGPIVIDKLYKYFTPAVTGSVVLAVGMCLILNAWNDMVDYNPTGPDAMKMFLIGIAIAAICVIIDHFAKGIVQSLAVLIAMVAGYVFCSVTGMVDFSQVLALIPNPVLGGILLVTFGNIIASGIKVIGFDENNKRNFTIIALAAAVGIGGNFAQAAGTLAFLPSTVVTLFTGISGTAITALVLNIILPGEKKEEA